MSAAHSAERILVTGATGFIGSRLVARLADAGGEVHAAVRPGSSRWRLAGCERRILMHEVDLRDQTAVQDVMRRAAPSHVFHLATYRAPDGAGSYRDAYETNVLGLLNLLEASPRALTRFVHFASSTEYGPRREASSEDDALAPTTLHGVTKAAATLLCRQFAAESGLPSVVLRLFHVYGPWDRWTRFIPRLMAAALDGNPIALTTQGFRHDWTYVEDAVDAALMAARMPLAAGEVINVATGDDVTNEELRLRIERLSGHTIRVDRIPFPPRPWDSTRWVADVRKAREVLRWQPAHDLDAGLGLTLEWFRLNRTMALAE